MYNLDINFLQDRPEYNLDKGTRSSKRLRLGSKWNPIYLGLAMGILLPALAGSGWLFLQNKNAQLEQEIAQLDAQLNSLGIQEQQIQTIQQQTSQIRGETQSLATVFNQIRPWSAMLQDLSDRIPVGIQIESIKQITANIPQQNQPAPQQGKSAPKQGQPSTPQPSQPAPNPAGGIEITGMARSFNDVNDFLLTLQRSRFFNPIDTKIITAELIDSPISTGGSSTSQSATDLRVKPPQVVRYTIQSSLSDIPASELLRELERKGTLGLVSRIRTLQQTGVIQR